MVKSIFFALPRVFFLIIFILILTTQIHADLILLDDDEVLEGNIININEKEIILMTTKGELNVPKGIIKKFADNEEAEKSLREEIKHLKKTERLDKIKTEAKERLQDEVQKEIETATRIHSPRWTMARSAIFPGWGQAEAGLAGGTALMITSGVGVGIIAYGQNLSNQMQQQYEQTVVQNLAIVTLIPSSSSVQDRLATSLLLNQGACDGCSRINHQERDFQYLFGGFYLGQLAYLANSLGIFSAAPLAKNEDRMKFDFSVYQDRPLPNLSRQTTANFSFTFQF